MPSRAVPGEQERGGRACDTFNSWLDVLVNILGRPSICHLGLDVISGVGPNARQDVGDFHDPVTGDAWEFEDLLVQSFSSWLDDRAAGIGDAGKNHAAIRRRARSTRE